MTINRVKTIENISAGSSARPFYFDTELPDQMSARDFTNSFTERHVGGNEADNKKMLDELGYSDIDSLISDCVPENIRDDRSLDIKPAANEFDATEELRQLMSKNELRRSFIGTGYYGCVVPSVIKRLVLENPGWYTQYTPYQAEIAQGRLEALINFQTMVTELTGMNIANASLLDEATAAAEAMTLAFNNRSRKDDRSKYFVSSNCHPQTIAVMKTRAEPLAIELVFADETNQPIPTDVFGALLQYPHSNGTIDSEIESRIKGLKDNNSMVTLATDLLALCLIKAPGEMGADIAVGSSQRFGVPMGFGGPHAAFFATTEELKRKIPGRIVGVSKDRNGSLAYRLALQTREQHIRRDKATSNICTSQVLLAIMSSMYAVYHGPNRLKSVAGSVHSLTSSLAENLRTAGITVDTNSFFDTITISVSDSKKEEILGRCDETKINLRIDCEKSIGISLDETTTSQDLELLFYTITGERKNLNLGRSVSVPKNLVRTSKFMTQDVFNRHHTETQMLRYTKSLENKDLSLTHSMIPLGSCTMKLNSASSLYPVSWSNVADIHPFAPKEQVRGYLEMIQQLEGMLAEATGFDAISLQPNSGAQGEYAGLLTIRRYHEKNGDTKRNVCLIPTSAHGTNPASAVMAGMKVVAIKCDEQGNIDITDLKTKAEANRSELSAIMITYPSTHGVFEDTIREICDIVHDNGGQVYLDGANLNAQVGLCYPGGYGADVCHLNLHKTFSIPHGGGGPGVGPIGVKKHLAPFLPGHSLISDPKLVANDAVAAAPYGSAGILCIPWMYIRMLGEEGLRASTKQAILNANYLAQKLSKDYDILYTAKNGRVAHECIIDLRSFKKSAKIEVEDVAKRLMDFGFHAPTMSWPVAGTFMIEPTESESLEELERFVEAMSVIRQEISDIERDETFDNNVISNAPHTQNCIVKTDWSSAYSREKAVFPSEWSRKNKFWPPVTRIDNALGDRQLVCTCPDMSEYS